MNEVVSNRVLAKLLGVSVATVRRDLASIAENVPPDTAEPSVSAVAAASVEAYEPPDTVDAICARFGVSRRTAYRHLQRGTLPAAERVVSGGKSYPAGGQKNLRRRESTAPTHPDLAVARQALRRAARSKFYYPDDMKFVAQICEEATELWQRMQVSEEAKREQRRHHPALATAPGEA